MTNPALGAPGTAERPPLYPVEPWRIREIGFDPAHAARNETVFALANGRLGLRGNLEEDEGNVVHGTYLNGFHEEAPIAYGETAHGLANAHQVMLNVADGKRIRLEVDGFPLDLATGELEEHERTLDLRAGTLVRRVRWRSPGGRRVEVESTRLVSLEAPGVAAIDYAVTALDGPVHVRLVSTLDGRVRNQAASDDPRIGSHLPPGALLTIHAAADEQGGLLVQRTRVTRLSVAAGVRHVAHLEGTGPGTPAGAHVAADDAVGYVLSAAIQPGERLRLTKLLAYASSQDRPEDTLADAVSAALDDAVAAGFEGLADGQRRMLDAFWDASDVEIDGDGALQQGVRFNLFSIFQSAGRDGRTGLAAKGLTGEGYEGHYFWDTEIFALPFLVYTQPAIARALLQFRIATLPMARERAAEMSERGALYPWRTINGREASAYFPAGTAQYHINADIAYAMARYVAATGDAALLFEGGAEVVIETARLWLSLGAWIPAQGGAFCINEVTGPDEYTALVNNDAYTNLMARRHLRDAADLVDRLAREAPEWWAALAGRLALHDDEVADWRRAAEGMRIPRDAGLGIHAQDDAFLDREPWDFEGTPPEAYPLLLHFHPLVIYRHQVLKQGDVVLAQVLLASEFSLAEKRRNFRYYDPLTTGDSSLGPSIQGVAAAELGDADLAYRYFLRTARMDLDDHNRNVAHGVHIAAMAGSWVGLVHGFAGFRDDDGRLSFSPRLPASWTRLRFRLRVGGSSLEVRIAPDEVAYEVLAGGPVDLRHFGSPLRVEPGSPVRRSLRPRLAAVIFDLDGVLTDTAEHHFRAWSRLAGEESLPFDRALNEQLKGVSRMESLDIILDHAGREATLADRVRLADRKNAYFRELVSGIRPDDLLPGVRPLLAGLRARGVRTAIASMSHNVWDVVGGLGIRDLVDVIVDPASLAKGKPDPEIFLAAAAALGVRPDDCVGVEDAQAGIDAILAAGMTAVGVGTRLRGAHALVDDPSGITADRLEALVRGRPV